MEDFPFLLAEHLSPLRRPGTTYEESLQIGKENNVNLVSKHIHRILLLPEQTFSYHHIVGEPSKERGFVLGAELHDGALKPGIGGGACQVSNLLYVLALLSGCEIVQRYRHGFDLFPDSERTVPFGCGATVFFPSQDLRFQNKVGHPLLISLTIEDGFLVGRSYTNVKLSKSWHLIERENSIVEEGEKWIRRNIVVRVECREDGSEHEEVVAKNHAVCLYDPTE